MPDKCRRTAETRNRYSWIGVLGIKKGGGDISRKKSTVLAFELNKTDRFSAAASPRDFHLP